MSNQNKNIITDNGENNKISLPNNIKYLDILINGNNNVIEIGENVTVFGKLRISVSDNNSIVKIGKNTTIYFLKIHIEENNNKVEIGEDCMISDNVRILASDSHSIILNKTRECINIHKKGVKIGNHVWLGMDSLILKDSTIGDNCVVAAGAIVTNKKCIENAIFAGNPAKIIKKDINWERKKPKKNISEKVTLLEGEYISETIHCFIENIVIDKTIFKQLVGWTYLENYDSNDSEIYFEIVGDKKTEIYKAHMFFREDIAKNTNNNKYINSGFDLIIPDKLKINKIKNINLIIKNKDKLCKTTVDILRKD